MLTLDTNKLASFLGLRREVTGGVKVYDGSTVTNTLLPGGTLASFIIENSAPKGKFFGFAISQKITIELIEQLSLEKGTKIQPYLAIKGSEDSPILPFFYIDTVEIDTVKNTTKIVAYDAIYFASKRLLNEVDITYPLTLQQYATAVVSALDCSIAGTFDINPELTQETVNIGGSETIQDILGSIAEVTGTICIASSNNTIQFKTLRKQPEDTIFPATYFNFSSQEFIKLTKIASATQLGDNYISGDEEGFTQTIWDNPFLTLRSDIGSIVDAIQNKLCPSYMMPYSLESRGNPYYEIGDCVSILTPTEEKRVYWFNETLTYNGGLRSKTSWEPGEDEKPDANPTSLGEALKMTSAKVDKINNEVSIVAGKVEGTEEAIAALNMTTGSISASVTKLEEATTGALEGVHNDITSLTKKVEATMTDEAVDLKIQSAMANGVDKVTTSTGFTFNEAGLTISKSGSEMTTNIDEDGMSVSRGSTEVLTADNQGVIAYNLHAKTYLIIGENSRFEDYTNTNGEARTGCFWIGG